ncbi:GSCOCG00000686001-RA-CDS, partial [Cotesia congregata]
GGWSQGSDFFLHSIGDSWVHGGTSREDSVGVQVLTDVDVALHDRVPNGHCVRDTVSGIENDSSGTTRSVERKHSLDSDVHSRCVESFEHDLRHLLTVGFWVQWSLVGDDTVLNWVFKSQDTSL